MRRYVLGLLLALYILVLLYGGWMPFNFVCDRQVVATEAKAALHNWRMSLTDLARSGDARKNVLLFVPVGVLLAGALVRKWRPELILGFGLLLSAAVSLAIEAGQLLLPERLAGLKDLAMNTLGGFLGAVAGMAIFADWSRTPAKRLAQRVRRRYGYLGAGTLAAILVACSAWRVLAPPHWVSPRWSSVIWSVGDGLKAESWAEWLIRYAAAYAAITVLLAAGNGRRQITAGRALGSAGAAVGLAIAIQALHLVVPDASANLAAVLVAGLAALTAASVAPHLARRQVELPAGVLVGGIVVAMLASHLAWSSSGGGTRLPLWGLYRHEFLWGYYASMRRWTAMAGLGLLAPFYLSLTRPWRMRYRVLVGACIAWLCAAGLELAKVMAGAGTVNLAGLGEHVVAAAAGALAFALLWKLLDRRDAQVSVQFAGSERRRPRT